MAKTWRVQKQKVNSNNLLKTGWTKNMTITYRTGKPEDCRDIANLMDQASGGIIEYLYHDLFVELKPAEFVANNLLKSEYPYNYNSAIVAEKDGKVVGVSYSYPSSYHGLTKSTKDLLPHDRQDHLADFFSARIENSWFLDSLGVDASCRKLGIGDRLLKMTIHRAREKGFNSMSLLVFADNKKATRLYRKNGFIIAEKVEVQRHRLIPHDGGCLLMKKDLELT
jgi:ribosomal protein S18 acetylase RimI-like enzyme